MKKNVFLLAAMTLANFGLNVYAQCTAPDLLLGPDTSLCPGQSIQLSVQNADVYTTFEWDNGSTSPLRNVSSPGTYEVTGAYQEGNLIQNGDFELGDVSFDTDYINGTGGSFGLLSTGGQYAITTSPALVHDHFYPCEDITSGSGNMFVANGSWSAGTVVWEQTVTIDPFTDYLFSFWATNVVNNPNTSDLQLYVNGAPIGPVNTTTTYCEWSQSADMWNSGSATSATLSIINQSTVASGNDFAIDEIRFAPVCYSTATINVGTYPVPTIDATANDTICQGQYSDITAFSADEDLNYIWNPGAINNATLAVSPTTSQFYNVTATNEFGCISNLVTRMVLVKPAPTVSIAISNDSICQGETVELEANSTSIVTYSWSTSATTMNIIESPSTSQFYSVIVDDGSECFGYDTTYIEVIPQLEVGITGITEYCDGEVASVIANANHPAATFLWNDGSSFNTYTLTASNDTLITLIGTLYDCPTDTTQLLLNYYSYPTIQQIGDQEICEGETLSFTAGVNPSESNVYWSPINIEGNSIAFKPSTSEEIAYYADNHGCVSEPLYFYINVLYGCDIELPNVFTPNGDDVNDYFQLVNSNGIIELTCVIVNRWGNEIQSFDSPQFKWNGQDKNGTDLSDGVYFYSISGVNSANVEINKQGQIHLIR